MDSPHKIIEDSSIWQDPTSYKACYSSDTSVKLGVVKSVFNDGINGDVRYLVEIQSLSIKVPVSCVMLRRFGGAYNYEDIVYRGYKDVERNPMSGNFVAKAGDAVLVAFINGETRFGVILGGLMHAGRKGDLKVSDGPQYKSEFNGVETDINKDGEYKLTFKGQPTNLAKLNFSSLKPIEKPIYNTDVGTSFMKFNKTGGIELNDNSKSDKQSIAINKAEGTINISSGKISLILTKKSEDVSLKSKTLNINSENKISIKTKETSINSSTKISIKSPKVAIGKEGVELLDQLSKLIDAIGTIQPISPIGPCTPLKATPTWAQVEQIKSKIKEITGTF